MSVGEKAALPLTDGQDRRPAAWDADGAEIWPGEVTVVYRGREIALETFQDETVRLARTAPLALAEALGLEIRRYGERGPDL